MEISGLTVGVLLRRISVKIKVIYKKLDKCTVNLNEFMLPQRTFSASLTKSYFLYS